MVGGVGLIAWRGDRLRSAGGIDSPVSREGAFLANNVLFVGFAAVVLLGTVFPLLYEALNPSSSVTVGAPYFNRFFIPVGLALLFLMAVAPALHGAKTSLEVMRGRLAVPAALGVLVVVACVLGGIHGIEALLAFGWAPSPAGSAGRALVLSVRGAYRGPGREAPPGEVGGRRLAGLGRANGGMVVHIGVVVIAIGLAAATSFLHRGESTWPRASRAASRHSVTFVGTRQVASPSHSAFEAVLRVDGGGMFYPAISQFGSGTQAVGTPAIDSSWKNDLYLTIDSIPKAGAPGPSAWWNSRWSCGCGSAPWWSGSAQVLSAVPGRRRRPTDPVSTPAVKVDPPPAVTPTDRGPGPAPGRRRRPTRCRSAPVDPGMTGTEVEVGGGHRVHEPAPAGTRPVGGWLVLIIAVGMIAVLATRPPAQTVEARNPLVDTPSRRPWAAPRWTGPLRLPRVPGQFVVVNFFASWCTQCQEEGPSWSPSSSIITCAATPRCSASCSATLGRRRPTIRRPG